MSDIGTVTVAERPTRILVVLFGLAAVGVTGLAVAATVATAVWAALGAIALVQLSVAVQRALRDRR